MILENALLLSLTMAVRLVVLRAVVIDFGGVFMVGSFERMRIFKGERGRVALRLRLPLIDDEGEGAAFNELYSILTVEYMNLCEALSRNATGNEKFEVGFTYEYRVRKRGRRERKSLIVKRYHKHKKADAEAISEYVDVYDPKIGVFVG